MRAAPGRASHGRQAMDLGNRFSFRPVEENRLEEVKQDNDRSSAMKQRRDVRQPDAGPVSAATQGERPEALARPIALAAALTPLAGGALTHDPGGGFSKQEAMRLLRAYRVDKSQHLRAPELREEPVEMLVAHHCIRMGCAIWPSD